MDNQPLNQKEQVVTGPSIRVCPVCGPTAMGFAGRIIPQICESCSRHMKKEEPKL